MPRGRSVEVYLKPGIEEDDLIHAVWREAALNGRPQDLYRRILFSGIRSLYESGDLPRTPAAVVEQSGLLLARVPPRRPRGRPRKHPLPQPAAQSARASPDPVMPESGDRVTSERSLAAPRPQDPGPGPGVRVLPLLAERPVEQPPVPTQPDAPTAIPATPPPRPAVPVSGSDAPASPRPRLGRLMA